MGFADLHIHSMYSDGTLTPAEIVSIFRARTAAQISVCDHHETRGTTPTAELARAAGLKYVSGVEIDAIHRGADIHILCYGADLSHPELRARIRKARERLDGMSDALLARMLRDYPRLSREEYARSAHDPARGGWKLLQYLQDKGVTENLHAGFPLYERYGVTYAEAGFDCVEDVVRAIHAAGGRAVLAHPGVVFPTDSLQEFAVNVNAALDTGLDGVECHYPRHNPGVTRRCLEICAERGLMITAGSDCHGAFNHNEIAQTRTPLEKLNLDGLKY